MERYPASKQKTISMLGANSESIPLYNKGALEIILDGKASGTIRPDGFNVEAIRRQVSTIAQGQSRRFAPIVSASAQGQW